MKRLEAGHYEGAGFSVYRVEKTEWYSFSRGREGAWCRKVKYWVPPPAPEPDEIFRDEKPLEM